MISQIITFTAFISLVVALAAATPVLADAPACNTGTLQCCSEVKAPTDPSVEGPLSGLNIILQSVVGQIGLNCNPINVIGVCSNSGCDANPVCCAEQANGGLVGIGCVPVSL
ncbi:fungal hydrophobin [Trametes elegans]|nr:fungal hydrophobin [Trametes elegans]